MATVSFEGSRNVATMLRMKALFSEPRHAVYGGRRVGSWLLKGIAGALYFATWFSWDGYGFVIDCAMFTAAALLVWLAWFVEGKP